MYTVIYHSMYTSDSIKKEVQQYNRGALFLA